jgi:hypothetical protein
MGNTLTMGNTWTMGNTLTMGSTHDGQHLDDVQHSRSDNGGAKLNDAASSFLSSNQGVSSSFCFTLRY